MLLLMLIIITVITLSLFQSKQVNSSAEMVTHTQEVLIHSEKLLSAVINNEIAAKDYGTTDPASSSQSLQETQKEIYKELLQLKILAGDNPVQLMRIDTLQQLIRSEAGFISTNKTGEGKLYVDSTKDAIYRIQLTENELLLLRKKANEKKAKELEVILTGVISCLLILLVILIQKTRVDLSERKKSALVLAKVNGELEQRVQERTEALHKTNKTLEDTFLRITDGFMALDKNWCYTYANKQIGELTRLDPAWLIGKNVWDIFPDAVGSATYEIFQRAMEEQHYMWNEDYFEQLDLWQENHVYPSPDGISVYIRDISEKKRKEKELQESNQRYQYVSKATSDSIWDWDLIKGTLYWGEGFQKIFGYSPVDLSPDIKSWTEHFHPEDADRVIKSIYDTIEGTANNWEENYRYRKANGLYADVEDRGFVIRNEKGRAIRMVGAMQDISRRKEEEHQRKLLESVVTNTKDAIIITDAAPLDGNGPRIIYVNDSFTKMTGYPAAEVIGKTPRILQGPASDRSALERLGKALRKWESCEITTINYKKDGTPFWVTFSVSPVANDKGFFTHWVAVERDVTAWKLAEQATLSAFNEKNTILESIDDGFYAVDHNWVITYWNKQVEKMQGKTKEEVLGKNLWDIYPYKDIVYNKFHKAVEENTAQHFEKRSSRVSAWYELSAYPSADGLSVYCKDVTNRKLAEIQVNQLNEELQEYAKKLATSNKELEQFAFVASHDLQEPLRMITGFLTQLENKYNQVLDEKGKQYIYFAVDGAKRMRQIILDLLEFSRIGRTEAKVEEVNLNELLKELLPLYRKEIQETAAEINIGELPTVRISISAVRQVFQNLISNSLKYHRAGVAPEIRISFKDTGASFQIMIADNGIGIDQQYFEKIFILFQRLHSKTTYSGTGMGLATVKKIIDNMGEKIWLTSEEGRGTTFYFTISKHTKNEA